MAYRAQPIGALAAFGGAGTLAILAVLCLGTLLAVAIRAEFHTALAPADWAAIRFTISQAASSAAISIILAIPAARALARRAFFGRGLMVALLGAPFILPAIVAVFALLAVWGRAGLASDALGVFGVAPLNIYGFSGVVLAHVFFNLPLATRLILQGWLAIPAEQFRLCAQLGMSTAQVNRVLERPILRAIIPFAFVLIFLLCVSSFAVALALGGGPRATTIELAIYQSLRFDFDLGKAANLALIQFMLCAALATLAVFASDRGQLSFGLDAPRQRWDGREAAARLCDGAVLILTAVFLFLPLAALITRGLPALTALPESLWRTIFTSASTSILIAASSATLTIGASLALSNLILRLSNRRSLSRATEAFGVLSLAISPFVMGTGLFVIINLFTSPFDLAIAVVILVNAAMTLPFALRIILPAMARAEASYGTLSATLGMVGWTHFRLCLWPRLRRPIGFAAGLALALSMGDLGVIALFAPPNLETLPLLMYRLMEAYRLDAAGGVALVLVLLSFGLFWLCDRGGRLGQI